MATIESKVAGTILQRSMQIEVDGVAYNVAPPTCETLILYSEEISNIKAVDVDPKSPIKSLAKVGPQARHLHYALAILILGSERLIEKRRVWGKSRFGIIPRKVTVVVDRKKELGDELIKKDPEHLNNLAATLLHTLQVKNFIMLITSLAGLNLLKPTKVVSKKATRSGR